MNHIKEAIKGWFVGNFEPTAYRTTDCEVGIKEYKQGDFEASHHHKIATEITVVIQGTVEMCGRTYAEGSVITILPGESTSFKAVTDAKTVVVKLPGANDDKYLD